VNGCKAVKSTGMIGDMTYPRKNRLGMKKNLEFENKHYILWLYGILTIDMVF